MVLTFLNRSPDQAKQLTIRIQRENTEVARPPESYASNSDAVAPGNVASFCVRLARARSPYKINLINKKSLVGHFPMAEPDHSRPAGREVLRPAQREPHSGDRPHRSRHRPGGNRCLAGSLGLGQSPPCCVCWPAFRSPPPARFFWHGKPILQTQVNVGIVFQSFALFPWLTVLENVEAPLIARGITAEQREGADVSRS